jgi:3-oxoacyl-[acyl-carrier protein] reductase
LQRIFKGKTAIVTGGTRGIGRAIVLELGRQGCIVAFNYLQNQELADSLIEEIRKVSPDSGGYQCDVRDFEKVRDMVEEVRKTFGRIDFLVNNAGIIRDNPLYKMEEGKWDEVVETNLKGVYNFSRAVITPMMKQEEGKILNITSVSGIHGRIGQTNYSASKAGIIGFTKALAKEVAKFNIAVNAIAPGFIETDMLESMPEEKKTPLLSTIPLRRFGSTVEVAHLASFLLSDEANYITGQVIPIDGGMSY